MGKFGLGQPVRRTEDARLLTGRGRYTGDISIPGQVHAAFVRSPVAHADIRAIDLDAAAAAPGVVAVYTAADLEAAGIADLPCQVEVKDRAGRPQYVPPRPVFARDRVRFVGEPIVMVVAATETQAKDAAELVDIDFDELTPVVDTASALDPDTPHLWPDGPTGNCALHWERGDRLAVEAVFDAAAEIAEIRLINNRVIANPIEPRVALADYDAAADILTLYTPTQGVHRVHRTLTEKILHVAPERVRIVSEHVGGGFGVRSKTMPEMVGVAFAAKTIGRPVKWTGDRTETMVIDNHGRDLATRARLALDAAGRILALEIDTIANMGAYLLEYAPVIQTLVGPRSTGTVYAVPALYHSVRLAFTNTVPVDSYRGAGRPEAAYLMERLMDQAARVTGRGRRAIRRLNFIADDAFPYRNTQEVEIDSGDFAGTQKMAVEFADWQGFAARREQSRSRGLARGIGIGCFLEASGGATVEEASVEIDAQAGVTARAGTHSHGQGHATVFAQLVAERLGLPFAAVTYIDAIDTDLVAFGNGTSASRSSQMGGVALSRAVDEILAKATGIAAHALQTEPGGVAYADGVFTADGATMTMAEVAATAADRATLPPGMEPGLAATHRYDRGPENFNYPNGCHIAEVEIDPATGVVEIVAYTGVDDVGTVLNPMIVHGQTHGGIAQGLGQAALERTVYEPGTGQLITASFIDYAMPRATDMPAEITLEFNAVPCTTNDLGVKGAGEGGACGAPPAIVSAVLDALGQYGVTEIDMPLTPERVWRAIRNAAK